MYARSNESIVIDKKFSDKRKGLVVVILHIQERRVVANCPVLKLVIPYKTYLDGAAIFSVTSGLAC